MPHDNNVSIGSVGAGNTINIAQHQAPDAPRIEYSVATDSIERVSQLQATKGAVTFYGSLSLPVLAIVADLLGTLSFLGIQTKWALVVTLPLAVIGANLSNTRRKLVTTTFKPNEAQFVDGRWAEQEDDGSYVLYRKTAPCIYPHCSGTVFIRTAPPREQPNHSLVGVCDVGAYRHTYTVDFNGIGFPQQFDWKPPEECKQ